MEDVEGGEVDEVVRRLVDTIVRVSKWSESHHVGQGLAYGN